MKLRLKKLSAPSVVAMALFGLTPVHGSGPDRVGNYDFGYQAVGDNRVRPVQVFDDGKSTFFQFRAGEPIPAIFADTATGQQLVIPQLEGPYIRVPGVAVAYRLRLGLASGGVSYAGAAGRAVAPVAADESPVREAGTGRMLVAMQAVGPESREAYRAALPRPSLEVNSYAVPLRGDIAQFVAEPEPPTEHAIVFAIGSVRLSPADRAQIRKMVASTRRLARVEVIGRDDPSHREGIAESRAKAVADELAAAGVARTLLSVKSSDEVLTTGKTGVKGVTVKVFEAPKVVVATAGRPDDVDFEALLRKVRAGQISRAEAIELMSRGPRVAAQPASAVAAPSKPLTAPVVVSWQIRTSDETVEKMLARWAAEAGWRVIWKGGPEVAITTDSKVDRPDFLQAADVVIAQVKNVGYGIKAKAYANNILVVSGDTNAQ